MTTRLPLALGPSPAMSLATLRSLGMSRRDIAAYFRIEPEHLADIEARFGLQHVGTLPNGAKPVAGRDRLTGP